MKEIEILFYSEFLDRLNNTVRWNGTKRIKDETVAHHSFLVSWLVRVFVEKIFNCDTPKLIATTYAIFHDFDENITGDVLSPLKYNDINGEELRKLLDEYIKHETNRRFPKDTVINSFLNEIITSENVPIYIKKIVKVADWMSMQFYLKKEMDMGNLSVVPTMNRISLEIEKAVYTAKVELLEQTDYVVNLDIFKD